MNKNTIISPSNQVRSTLPDFISESYKEFVKFMTTADQSEERIGFSQDLLQNLQKYRDFDTYKKKIIEYGVLAVNIDADSDELTLESGYGFPEEDGILYINDEIILYREKVGNVFSGLQRGASGTVILPTFTYKGTYLNTVAAKHTIGSSVQNLSVLFLVSFLETIYKSYAPNINSGRVSPEVDSMTFLENIRDFFQSKGSKLGIKALFKLLFAENDVDVNYPGDRMIVPSKSTWSESLIMRTVPIPRNLVDPYANYAIPTKMQNSVVLLKSYNSEDTLATSICDYVSAYPYEDNIQYEMYLNKDKNSGEFLPNPVTELTRATYLTITSNTGITDITTITVESTLGFANSGVFFIEQEGIQYTSKSLNQFFGCKRGHIGIEAEHQIGSKVYGPLYIEAKTKLDGIDYTSFSWPLGLVKDVDVVDPGLMHKESDVVYINGPGRIDPRVQALTSFVENYDEQLVVQGQFEPGLTFVQNYTAGVSGVYFDKDYVFVGSSGFPYYTIGPFSGPTSADFLPAEQVGPNLEAKDTIYVIPRELRENNNILDKGTDEIGIAVDGVPIYSDVSPVDLTQGLIKTFNIINRGSGYLNPTVILDPPASIAEARVVNGQISLILQKTTGNYRDVPSVRITSGEGASFYTTFDNYGRLTAVEINTPGEYYNDVPSLSVVDSSGRGTGALVSCTVEGRVITSVTIEQPGIDYNPLTTSIVTTPIGQGAIVEAVVENYRFNRYQSVINNPNWSFDAGNGFLWGDVDNGLHSTFGYVCDPLALRYKLGDTAPASTRGDLHSPIIGWAFDGNPIYGPWGWTNGKNNSGGVELQISGYVLRSDRSALGTEPPSVEIYSMGSFVEDYAYQPPLVSDILLTADDGDFLQTGTGLDISTDSQNTAINVLDTNNGKLCNTPEYPEDLYPNGVFCYFVTINEAGVPQFPYMIGTTFNNRPISQKMSVADTGISPDFLRGPVYSPSSYDDTELTFNFTNVERFRNPYLRETKQDVDLKIADVTSGSLSQMIVESGLPATTKCGDILYFDDTDKGGSGAEGKVSYVTGENILSARGSLVYTYLKSHRQLIDLSSYKGNQSFVFVRDTYILCSSGALAQVVKWNTDDYTLEVRCLTYSLVKYGDTFYDNRGVFVELIPRSDDAFFLKSGQRNSVKSLGSLTRPNNVTISYTTPNIVGIDGVSNEPGDLWWSIRIGRLFVWYDDGDTSQWVQTQPMGMQPILNTASDTSVGVSDSTTPSALTTGSDTVVTISTMAPAARADGSPNALGDLWWSNYTGMFYIWYYDILGPNPNVGIAQWVMATPTGTVPMEGATDYLYPELSTQSVNRGNVYTSNLTCMISDIAPTTQTDGSSLEYGNLWWCSINGKMFIYWDDGTTVQWTQTTPVGAVSTFYGDDKPLDPTPGPGPGPYPPDPGGEDNIGVIPEPKDQRLLWFDDMTNFLEGDLVNFQLGAPGVDGLTEISKLETLGTPDNDNGLFIRGYNDNALVLPNLTIMVNDTRAVYQVNCDTPTKLLTGDMVFIENSSFAEVNGVHQVVQAGHVIPATITVQIDEDKGTVSGLTIVDPGQYYAENFYITFFGGGGQGAYGYATVEPLVLGGKVKSVEILQAGINYRSVPTAILGTELTNKQFQIYVYGLYGDDNASVTYSAFGEAVENTAAYIEVTSGGVGYKEIPPALGLYKKIGDRAQLVINRGTINPEGGAIVDVTVEQGGSRYVSPTAVFSDRLNAGSGATADVSVSNGVVTAVTVTNGGTGYIEPTLTLVEESGKYISLTKTIGRITAGSVINPGRDISVDRSLKPELQITTRCIIRYINTFRGEFIPGSTVYQGDSDVKFVTAKVISYDDKIQQLTLEKVDGVIKENELFKDDFGTTALVILNGEADCRAVVSGTSEPEGVFINDTSKVSAKYAVIQDSLKYQWFSYEIASPLPRVDYENFVNDIVHPSGFIMFSKLDLNDSVESSLRVIDPEFKPQLP